jgi:quercetin dioxygenase-like cupin family protein
LSGRSAILLICSSLFHQSLTTARDPAVIVAQTAASSEEGNMSLAKARFFSVVPIVMLFTVVAVSALSALIAQAGSARGQAAMHDILVRPDALIWKDNPNIPKGGQVAILVGDPRNTGEVVVQRLKFPPNYHVPPHTHPYAEYGTVISGSFSVGVGEKLEKTSELFKPGSFWMHPARHAHYGWTGNEEVIIQIQFIGPGGIDYVNPADDPRNK